MLRAERDFEGAIIQCEGPTNYVTARLFRVRLRLDFSAKG